MAELTWAKVAGHDYGVTIFQYQEIMHHIDPELMWIVNEAVSKFMEPDASKTYRVYDLFYTVARELLPVIVEREKAEAKPNFGEVAEIKKVKLQPSWSTSFYFMESNVPLYL